MVGKEWRRSKGAGDVATEKIVTWPGAVCATLRISARVNRAMHKVFRTPWTSNERTPHVWWLRSSNALGTDHVKSIGKSHNQTVPAIYFAPTQSLTPSSIICGRRHNRCFDNFLILDRVRGTAAR